LLVSGVASAQQSPYSPFEPRGTSTLDGLSVVYDPDTGRVTATPPAGTQLTAFELRSADTSRLAFTGNCEDLGGPFDVCTPTKVFKLKTAGFDYVDFGAILPANLPGNDVLADLLVGGASVGGGFKTGTGKFLVHPDFVPEPLSATLFGLGAVVLGAMSRRRRVVGN
jgi:hypothetical protein